MFMMNHQESQFISKTSYICRPMEIIFDDMPEIKLDGSPTEAKSKSK